MSYGRSTCHTPRTPLPPSLLSLLPGTRPSTPVSALAASSLSASTREHKPQACGCGDVPVSCRSEQQGRGIS